MTPDEAVQLLAAGRFAFSRRTPQPDFAALDPVAWFRDRVADVGKTQAMAEAGIKRETARRWLLGTQRPSKATTQRVRDVARRVARLTDRRNRLTATRERKIRRGQIREVYLVVDITISKDKRIARRVDLRDALLNSRVAQSLRDELCDGYLSTDADRTERWLDRAIHTWVGGASRTSGGDIVEAHLSTTGGQ